METTETITEVVREAILQECLIPNNKVLKYVVTSLSEKNLMVKICTQDKKYSFLLKKSLWYEDKNVNATEDIFDINSSEEILNPIFLIDANGTHFYGFNKIKLSGYYVLKGHFDLPHMKMVLDTLAKYHSENITKRSANIFSESDLKRSLNILHALYGCQNINSVDVSMFKEELNNLAYSQTKLFKSDILVKSIENITQSDIYFKYAEDKVIECKILKTGSQKCVPPAYDVLRFIFTSTNEKFRQYHLHELLDYYYKCFKDKFKQTALPNFYNENEIKLILPFVKLETAMYAIQSLLPEDLVKSDDNANTINVVLDYFKSNKSYRDSVTKALTNIVEHINYPRFSKEDCYLLMKNTLGTADYDILNYQLISLEERTGQLGDYFKVKVSVNHKSGNQNFIFFAKFVPEKEMFKKIAESGAFEKEGFLYKSFLRECMGYGLSSIADFGPKCYFVRSNDVIILEDMSQENFRLCNIREPFTIEMLRVTIKQLAKLHACSLLLEEIKSKKAQKDIRLDDLNKKSVEEILFKTDIDSDVFKMNMTAINVITNYVIGLFPEVCKTLSINEFGERIRTAYEVMFEKMKKSHEYRNVLCHGDIWATNILFKFNSKKEATDCCLIDFQLTRYCPPAHDLMLMFYINTDKQTREKCMPELINEYYKQLSDNLKEYNCDIKLIYPYETFKESCVHMKSQAICQAALYTQITMCPSKELEKLYADHEKYNYYLMVDKRGYIDEMIKCPIFKSRFKELIEELYNLCINKEYEL